MFKKWYTIFMANNEVKHLCRQWDDMWIFDTGRMMSFHDKDGKRHMLSKHFMIEVVEE